MSSASGVTCISPTPSRTPWLAASDTRVWAELTWSIWRTRVFRTTATHGTWSTTDVARIVPAAEQLLTRGRAALKPSGETTYLDRPCQEYRFTVDGTENGIPYRSEVNWLVSDPYLLVRDVRDSRIQDLHALTEVLELEEAGFEDEVLGAASR
jgi:hypothetical protein